MQGNYTTKSTFCKLIEPLFSKVFQNYLEVSKPDKYVKKLFTNTLVAIMVYAQLNELPSLRTISDRLNNDELKKIINLDSISHSQISRSLKNSPTEALQIHFKSLSYEVIKNFGVNTLNNGLGNIHLIDSSTISLCLSQHQWAEFKKTKAGIKLHLRLRFVKGDVAPEKAIVTPAKPADKKQMDSLIIEEQGALNVFDRAYIDYKKFDEYSDKGIFFATRLKKNAKIHVVKDLPVDPESSIIKHQIALLGDPNVYQTRREIRLIETLDTKGNVITIITNNFTLNVEEISDIYRYRWAIELFFKWIKQNLKVKHFYGKSKRAIENQILIALITYLLFQIIKLKTEYKDTLLNIKRLIQTCICEPFLNFTKKLHKKPTRQSKGRQKQPDHELIYEKTLEEIELNEADYLYETSIIN